MDGTAQKAGDRGINVTIVLFWGILCVLALSALGRGPISLDIVRIAFVGIVAAHAFRLHRRISFSMYVAAESIGIAAILGSGFVANNVYVVGFGASFLALFAIILLMSIFGDEKTVALRRK